ncbi:MAG: hypothetical protein A3H96_20770 [Acidobacteria bacterium RIFCSPLOWO2_02_FULL_67_36]|nr:MAG: hypothetical protein A3H96_20770 [Acidobacteria bacterium RIFCSPLOWO2_02_FULL_67_36]OFW25470.1 MAG: hypothetical protein A3G21_19485 [Acidobacteria bacterium RIFCSPLOWO2_12_FULL_66_21]
MFALIAPLLLLLAAFSPLSAQGTDDPEIRAAVDRFFEMQVAEDMEGYLSLWSSTVQRPTTAQLKYIFDSGDDKFTDISIVRVTTVGDRIRVRVAATRERTSKVNTRPDGTPMVFNTRLTLALTFIRENGALKLVSEGTPADDLATALIAAGTPEARAALLDAEPDLIGQMLLSSLSRRGENAVGVQLYSAAYAIFERAAEIARRIGDRKGEGLALQNMGNAKYFQHSFPAALDAYRRRLALEREIANDEGIASALLGVATVQYSQFEYGDALASYREAAAVQERTHDDSSLGTTLISTGNVLYLQGDYEGAIGDYSRSRELLHKSFNLLGEARALEGLGRVYTAQGDYASALTAFAGMLAEGRARTNRPLLGNALQDIGDVHFRLGNLDIARASFDESRGHFEATKDLAGVGRLWQALAITDLVASRFGPAEQEYGRSMAACTAVDDRECVARAIVGLAFAQSSQEHFDDAIASYRKGIDAFTALKKTTEASRAEVGLSQAYLGRKDYQAALAAADRALKPAKALEANDVVWRAQVAAARAWRRLGQADKAMAVVREAAGLVQRMTYGDAVQNPTNRVAADAVSAYALLAILQAEAGDARGALVMAQQRAAQARRTALANNERDIWRGMTPAEREEEHTLTVALISTSVQLEQERALPKPDKARIARLELKLAEQTRTRTVAQERLFGRLPELRIWRGLGLAPTEDEAIAAVPSGSAVVQFVVDEDDLLVLTVVRTGEGTEVRADVKAGPRQALAEKVAALGQSATLRDPAAWREAAAAFLALLPEEAVARLAASPRAIVVPDGILWRVPFEALPIKDAYLADRTALTYAASLGAAPSSAGAQPAVPLLAVAAPDIDAPRIERIAATVPGWTPRPLEAAEREANEAAALFDTPAAAVLSRGQATESAFRAQAQGAAILHVAAPFRVNGASPLFSRVFLSIPPAAASSPAESGPGHAPAPVDPTVDPADDGTLESREIVNLTLGASLAVLSDGSAATGRDGAAALPIVYWSWRAAGVQSMVLSRWGTDDQTSTDLLKAFHARVKAGDAPGPALHAAAAALRAKEATRAPVFWASWMVIGG